ncbi:MAG: peptide-methionine (S)-S-oxide reductase MsrA [Puia sp.]
MKVFLSFFLVLGLLAGVKSYGQSHQKPSDYKPPKDLSKYSEATFASGCFWCMEAVFESVKGVQEAVSGFAGGKERNPTYDQVSDEKTGHAETVQVYYDPAVVSYATLVKVYFGSQNPTQVNGQGPDEGSSYRSIIFYRTPEEKMMAERYKAEIQKNYTKPVAAQIVPFEKFWPAEKYHQDYIKRHPNEPYVLNESIPRIRRFQQKFPELIKPDQKF